MTLTKESNGLRKKQVDEDVERLKDWLEKQPHLPHDVDDTLLRSFVTGTKGLEIAKQKLDAWFSYKGKVPQLFSDAARNPLNPDFKKQSKACQLFFLPKLTPDGYLVQWLKVGPEMDLFNHPQKIARLTMQIELAMLLYPENKGYMTVYDLENLPASVLTRLSASCTAAGLQWFQLAMPLKLKKAVIFNSIPVVDVVMNTIIKPFLKEKLFKRISVTSDDASSLKNHLPIEMLPSEYGGSEKSSDELNAEWEKKLEEKADWFRETAKLVSDEKKRPADKANTYGVEGTFRTLAID